MSFVYIKTFGCQMNEYDSQLMSGLLKQKGYKITQDFPEADLILVNTCYVREKVKNKVYSLLGKLRKLKAQKPHLILGIWGCLVQKEPEEMLRRAPYLDVILGTHNFYRLPQFLDEVREKRNRIISVDSQGIIPEGLPVLRENYFTAYVPVIRGCDNFCTYCNVPYVRGRERSRLPSHIKEEVHQLAEEGYLEITLLGQNVNSYGRDLDDGINFSYLLEEVSQVKGIKRIRFLTSHPRDLSDELMEKMARLKKVCPHLHLPLQSGSNYILQQMGRGYRREEYLRLVEKIRQAIPGISLTTDIIVGFPGERERDFKDTLEMIKTVKFDGSFTFIYSPLKGTRAAKFEGEIPASISGARLRKLIDLQRQIVQENNKSLVGQSREVLVEGPSSKDPQELQGRTTTNKVIIFQGEKELIGRLVRVEVLQSGCWALRGRKLKC